MVTWRIYYEDSTFSDEDGDVADAPALGVIAIVQTKQPHSRFVEHDVAYTEGYYWWEGGRWYAGDQFGMWDYLTRPGLKRVLFGRMIHGEAYIKALNAATEDQDFR